MWTLLAAFIVNFTAGGILFSFGIYEALYETQATKPLTPFTGASSSDIDLVGSLSASVMTMCAPFTIAWAKYFNTPRIVWAGALLFGLANVLASFGTSLWHFQLAQGLLLGIGTSLTFVPSMAVTPTWFKGRRGLAMGFASAGTGIGGLVWAPIITACVANIGFRDTLRLTGAVSAALLGVTGFALDWEPSMRARIRAESANTTLVRGLFTIPVPSSKIWKQRKYIAHAIGAACQSAAYYTPVFFLVSYARTLGYTEKEGANFVAISNACNAIGKVAIGFVADRMGRVNTFFLMTFLSAAVTLALWIPSAVLGALHVALGRHLYISFTVLYGLFASTYVSLFPAILVELFGMQQLPYSTSIMYMVQGMAALLGTPVAGLLVRGPRDGKSPNDYTGMAVLVGALLLGTTVCVTWVRIEMMLTPTSEKRRHWKM